MTFRGGCPAQRVRRGAVQAVQNADYLAEVTHAERTANTVTSSGDDLTLTCRRLDDQGEPLH